MKKVATNRFTDRK